MSKEVNPFFATGLPASIKDYQAALNAAFDAGIAANKAISEGWKQEQGEPVRKVFICKSCEYPYPDAPPSSCDCMSMKGYQEAYIYTTPQPKQKQGEPAPELTNIQRHEQNVRRFLGTSRQEQGEPTCKTHPDAPHGFVRNASHSEDRYVCECEFWQPPKQEQSEPYLSKAYRLADELKNHLSTAPAPQKHDEPIAMRYDFDGYGYKYIDSGSGSDWQTRIKDAEPVYSKPQPKQEQGEVEHEKK